MYRAGALAIFTASVFLSEFVPVYLFILMFYYCFAKERSFFDEKNNCFIGDIDVCRHTVKCSKYNEWQSFL